jgi:hypothetical protein
MVMGFVHKHPWLMVVLMVFVVNVFVFVEQIVQVFMLMRLRLEGQLCDRQHP